MNARHATASQVLSRPASVASSASHSSSPSQFVGPRPSEASVDEVFSDLGGTDWQHVVRTSEIIGMRHEGQSDLCSSGSFVKQQRKEKGKDKAVTSGAAALASSATPASTMATVSPPPPASTSPKIQVKGKGKDKSGPPAPALMTVASTARATPRAVTPSPNSAGKANRKTSVSIG